MQPVDHGTEFANSPFHEGVNAMLLDVQGSAEQAGMLKLIHDYVYITEVAKFGVEPSGSEARRLSMTAALLQGDPEGPRRKHRRMPALFRGRIKGAWGDVAATVLNVSGGGFFLLANADLDLDTRMMVTVCHGDTRFEFPVRVCRFLSFGNAKGYGVAFDGVPLELRRGYQTVSLDTPDKMGADKMGAEDGDEIPLCAVAV